MKNSLIHFHQRYIRNSPTGSIVVDCKIFIGKLNPQLSASLTIEVTKVYITTRSMKHIYDKRQAQVYDFFLQELSAVIEKPSYVVLNGSQKTGQYGFVKIYGEEIYFASVELKSIVPENIEMSEERLVEMQIVTFFRTDEKYISKFKILWIWEDKNPIGRTANPSS